MNSQQNSVTTVCVTNYLRKIQTFYTINDNQRKNIIALNTVDARTDVKTQKALDLLRIKFGQIQLKKHKSVCT